MPAALEDLIEPGEAQRLASGFVFTEGPLWHPDGFFYFTEIVNWLPMGMVREASGTTGRLYRITPGEKPEVVRETAGGTNGTTFDLQGRLVICEPDARRLVRLSADGREEVLVADIAGRRLNKPNDVSCRSDGSLFFTDPGLRVPIEEREMSENGVWRIALDGNVSLFADTEYPNGLAFSPDERTLYVSNTRWTAYIHAFDLDSDGKVQRRRIFADMSDGDGEGVPDGMKVDSQGNVWCTGPGGVWVFDAKGTKLGIVRLPEPPANLAFGGPDLRTLLLTARTSVYSLRTKVAGLAHPWYARRS
jgi:gluconolactonase